PALHAELQLDRLKPKLSRRVLLLQSHQPSWHGELALTPGAPPVCHNLTAYLRDEAEFKDKLSPVALSLRLALPEGSEGLVLYGDTLVQAQVRGHTLGTSLLCPRVGFVLTTEPGHVWVPPALWSPACPQCPQPLPGM
ncbi:ITA2B protein, partial [Indicator maculatus]|nr:ITA2B protein [Indicator maculatus]